MSNFFSDLFLGQRPDYRQLPGMQSYIDAIPGDPGQDMYSRNAKHDLKMGAQGRIEDMYSLAPVLSAIKARGASDYATGTRQMSKDLAFNSDPALAAAMNSELSGKINEDMGLQFADAAGGAYNQAGNVLESRNRYRNDYQMQGALNKANLYKGSMYDARRPGGLLQDMMHSAVGVGQAAAMAAI
jgi:hypothetical protein